tara:strand:+ start:480 stop:662 length:183 start_codon:yes stop_codon:yes gene_type:complete
MPKGVVATPVNPDRNPGFQLRKKNAEAQKSKRVTRKRRRAAAIKAGKSREELMIERKLSY